jgi:hypothetical protein
MLLIRHPLTGGDLQRLWEESYYKAFRVQFDVTVVEEDCDLDLLCGRVEPDIIAFRGAYSALHRRIGVANAGRHADVPRVGLYFGDGFCPTRAAFFYDMELWGVDTYFTQTFYLSEHTPDIANRTFVLPQTFDEELFRDYGEAKTTPFIVFGEFAPWRPWRGETANTLMKRYPTMVCPHPGYKAAPGVGIGWVGEDYARALNRSQFSICDGSIFNCVLRKHVEIPATGAILISQPIDGLKEYGFADMENAVIGEGGALMTKIAALIADPARLHAVAKAGFELAHSRHASRHCDQLYRWFRLKRDLKPGESIVQHGTFGAFEIVRDGRSGALRTFPLQPNELTNAYLEAERDYADGAPGTAARKLVRVLELKKDYAPARLLLVRALLMSGRAQDAAQHARYLYNFAKQADQAPEPDPYEWSGWVLVNLCQGNLAQARGALESFPDLRHVELRRAACLIARLAGEASSVPQAARADDRPSVTVFHRPSLNAWLKDVESMLRACGQMRFAEAASALARESG